MLRDKNEELGMRVQYETQRGHIGLLRLRLAAATKEKTDGAAASRWIQQLEAELAAARADRERLVQMNQKLEAASAALRAQFDQIAAVARSEAAARTEVTRREQQLSISLRSCQEQLAAAGVAAAGGAQSLRAELERYQTIARDATASLTQQVTQNEALAAQAEAHRRRIEELEAELARRGAEGDGWRREREALEGRAKEAEGGTVGLRQRLEDAEARARSAEARAAAAEPKVRELEAALSSQEGARGGAMRELERRLAEAEAATRLLQGEHQSVEARLREAEAALRREREAWRVEKEQLLASSRAAEQAAERRASAAEAARAEVEGRLRSALDASRMTEERFASLTTEHSQLAADFDALLTLTFKQIDTDASGSLDGPEIRRALNLLGLTQVSDQQLIARHDGSRDAKIQMDEFPALVREILQNMRANGVVVTSATRPVSFGGVPAPPPSPPPPLESETGQAHEPSAEPEREAKHAAKPHWRNPWIRGRKHTQ